MLSELAAQMTSAGFSSAAALFASCVKSFSFLGANYFLHPRANSVTTCVSYVSAR